MERGGRDLESERRQNHHQRHSQQRGETRLRQPGRNARKFNRARQPVEQAETEQEERGGHPPEQEIFQARLGRFRPAPVKARQHVERKARELEREEGQQELLGHGHHQQARRRQQHERDKFRRVPQPFGSVGQRQGQTRQHQNSRPRRGAQRIEHKTAPGRRPGRAHPPHQRQSHEHRHSAQGGRRAPACRGRPIPGARQVEREYEQRPRHQRRLARQRGCEICATGGHDPPPFNTD